MAKRKVGPKPIETYDHPDKERANNPPTGLVTAQGDPDMPEGDQVDPYLAGAAGSADGMTGKTAAPVKDLAHLSRPVIPTLEDIREILTPALEETGTLRAIVFGSHARSEAKEFSDLDLVIVAETEQNFPSRPRDFRAVKRAWNWAIDMIVYTPAEYEMMLSEGRGFVEMLETEGVVIYER